MLKMTLKGKTKLILFQMETSCQFCSKNLERVLKESHSDSSNLVLLSNNYLKIMVL